MFSLRLLSGASKLLIVVIQIHYKRKNYFNFRVEVKYEEKYSLSFQCQQCTTGMEALYKREEEINVYFRALLTIIMLIYSCFKMKKYLKF